MTDANAYDPPLPSRFRKCANPDSAMDRSCRSIARPMSGRLPDTPSSSRIWPWAKPTPAFRPPRSARAVAAIFSTSAWSSDFDAVPTGIPIPFRSAVAASMRSSLSFSSQCLYADRRIDLPCHCPGRLLRV